MRVNSSRLRVAAWVATRCGAARSRSTRRRTYSARDTPISLARRRASDMGVSLAEYVRRLVERDLAAPQRVATQAATRRRDELTLIHSARGARYDGGIR